MSSCPHRLIRRGCNCPCSHTGLSPGDNLRTTHFHLLLGASASDVQAPGLWTFLAEGSRVLYRMNSVHSSCPGPSQPGLARTAGSRSSAKPAACPLPAQPAPLQQDSGFFPFHAVETLRFLSAHPASPVSGPGQAENGYLDGTGGGAAGGAGAKDRGPGAGGLVAGSLPCEETVVSVLMQQGSRVCIRNDKTKYQQVTCTPPTNRKQELDKNALLFAAAASTTRVAEGHTLDRKRDCFRKGEVAKFGGLT